MSMQASIENRIPLTVITGYLGAGKTTLLRHILEKSGKKLAILMNEFGDIAIDSKIIEGKNVKIAELAGGCVCCSLTGELELAIKEIIDTASPEWIILETTGVAEPNAIAIDMENMPEVLLDAVVTIVDGDSIIKYPKIGHTGIEQIQMANIIILNKIDLIDEKQVEHAEKKLREINPNAVLVKAIRCKIPPTFIFGVKTDALPKQSKKEEEHDKHAIKSEVFTYESDGTFGKEKFLEFAKALPKGVERSKGFILCEDKNSYLFNFVSGNVELEPFASDRTELVFIGKGILKFEKGIKEKLEKCIVKG